MSVRGAGSGAESAAGGIRTTAFVFLLVFFSLQYVYSVCQGTILEHLIIDVATVRPSVEAVNFIAPDAGAVAEGHRIVSSHGSLSVLNGCEGTESMFLLMAAFVAISAPLWQKLKGAMLGMLFVYILNQARIVVLFFAVEKSRKWFELLHGYVAPTLIIVLGCLYFLWWTKSINTNEPVR